MLSNSDNIATGDFANADLSLIAGVQVDMVRPNTSSDTELEVLGLSNEIPGQVTGVERGTNVDVGINDFLGKLGVGSLLVRGNHVFVTILLEPVSDAKGILSLRI
jgi:hypothetical protein